MHLFLFVCHVSFCVLFSISSPRNLVALCRQPGKAEEDQVVYDALRWEGTREKEEEDKDQLERYRGRHEGQSFAFFFSTPVCMRVCLEDSRLLRAFWFFNA